MARGRKTWMIYPEYFNAKFSRSGSRKVTEDLAVNSPSVEEIGDILDSYDIPNRIEKHKHHPATWFERNGRVLISKQNIPKQKFIRKVAEKLKRKRSRES